MLYSTQKAPLYKKQLAAAATLYAAYPIACKTSSATARVTPFYVRANSLDWKVFGRFTHAYGYFLSREARTIIS